MVITNIISIIFMILCGVLIVRAINLSAKKAKIIHENRLLEDEYKYANNIDLLNEKKAKRIKNYEATVKIRKIMSYLSVIFLLGIVIYIVVFNPKNEDIELPPRIEHQQEIRDITTDTTTIDSMNFSKQTKDGVTIKIKSFETFDKFCKDGNCHLDETFPLNDKFLVVYLEVINNSAYAINGNINLIKEDSNSSAFSYLEGITKNDLSTSKIQGTYEYVLTYDISNDAPGYALKCLINYDNLFENEFNLYIDL